MSPLFIDYEAFVSNGKHIIKELCVINVDNPFSPLYYLFSPQIKYSELSASDKMTNYYLSTNHHYIPYCNGSVKFCKECIASHIKDVFPFVENSIVYVLEPKGSDGKKLKTLMEIFPTLNLVAYNFKKMTDLPLPPPNVVCPYMDHGLHCAYMKCLRMYLDYINFSLK